MLIGRYEMDIIVVDDEKLILDGEVELIRRCEPEAKVTGFSSAKSAFDFISAQPVDVAFLDIEMPGCSGVELAKKMKASLPQLNVIFATAYDSFFQDAMNMHASGYLLKPLREETVCAELADLRHPVSRQSKGLFIRTFGNFEVFYDNKPVLFRYHKTKEMLAYLVDRHGATVTKDEIVTALWGGEKRHDNYYKQIQKDLKDTFVRLGIEQLLVKQRGCVGLLADQVTCDYFDWLKGLPSGINAYHGEYMRQYDWAEATWVNLEGKQELWSL